MSNQTLHGLAKDYARGVIDKDIYRKSRTELIKGIVAGKIAVKAKDFAPPLLPTVDEDEEVITETAQKRERMEVSPQPTPQRTAETQNKTPQKTNRLLLVYISVCVVIVLLLIIAVFLFYPKPPGSVSIETSKDLDKSEITTKTTSSMPGESLLAEFLTQRNWNGDSLDKFIDSWNALSQEDRESVKQTKRMQRMNDSIYKQFLEAKALASIDSEKAIMKQQKLIDFAAAIGIYDSRLILDGE